MNQLFSRTSDLFSNLQIDSHMQEETNWLEDRISAYSIVIVIGMIFQRFRIEARQREKEKKNLFFSP